MKILGLFLLLIVGPTFGHAAESWLGIYMQGTKIGYSGSVTKADTIAGKAVTKTWTVNVLKSQMIGAELNLRIESTAWVDAKGNPVKMYFWTMSDGRTQTANAIFSKNSILLQVDNNGAKSKKTIPIQAGMRIVDDPIGGIEAFVSSKPNVGRTVYILDSTTLSLVKNEVIYRGKQSVTIGKQEFKADMIEVVDPRAASKVYFSGKGDLIKISGPLGMEMMPEEKSVAMNLSAAGTGSIDLSESTKVRVDRPIPNAGELTSVTLSATGVDLSALVSDDHQTITRKGSDWQIVIHPVPNRYDVTISTAARQLPDWVRPSQHMPSGSSEMVALAKTITGGSTSVRDSAERVRTYVRNLMQSNTGIGVLRDASEVLRTKEGLCRDHAILTGTLLRAAGIPARLVSGMVYEGQAFYYHAWVEFWNGKNWVGADSTRSPAQISAVHLKLAQGQVEDAFLFFVLDGARFTFVASESQPHDKGG